MAEGLRKFFDELRQNFNDDDGDEKERENEASVDDEGVLEGVDDDKIIAESKKLSIFCRNCLNPYVSETGKGGSIILKCEKCNHRDVITDDTLQDPNTEHSESLAMGGNLVLNRFQKVLLDKNDLGNLNLEDPELLDDDFKTVIETLPKITAIIKKTFSDMHKVTDDHRKVHNQRMMQRLKDEGQGELVEGEDGTRTWQFSVPIHGSDETDDLVIFPSEYKLPKDSIDNFRRIGRLGVQKVDKLVLNAGLSTDKLPKMPLFQRRLLNYCYLARKAKDKQSNPNTNARDADHLEESTLSVSTETPEIFTDHTKEQLNTTADESPEHRDITTNRNSSLYIDNQDKNSEENSTKTTESESEGGERASPPPHNTTSELLDIRRDIHVLEKLQIEAVKCNKKVDNSQKSDSSGEASERALLNIGEASECTQTNSDETSGNEGCRPKESKALEKDIKDNILPELVQFSDILVSIDEQRHLPNVISDEDVIEENWPTSCDNPENVSHIEANDAFNEMTALMIKRVSESKEQRMNSLIGYIKRAGRSMTDEVDRVQGDMIRELQIAYHSKRIKADRQRKRLEEAQKTLEHYREMVTHYHQTGQIDKLLEIMELLRDYESLN